MARNGIAGRGSDWEPAREKCSRTALGASRTTDPGPFTADQHPRSSRLSTVEDWEKFAAETGFRPERMAVKCGVCLRQLERFFKVRFGKSPTIWIWELRCRRAAKLIGNGLMTRWVAKEVGYANSSHFCHEFKKVYGVPPQAFARVAGGGIKCRH